VLSRSKKFDVVGEKFHRAAQVKCCGGVKSFDVVGEKFHRAA
jgi:hypothetical protein